MRDQSLIQGTRADHYGFCPPEYRANRERHARVQGVSQVRFGQRY